jgi:hypothetical protein
MQILPRRTIRHDEGDFSQFASPCSRAGQGNDYNKTGAAGRLLARKGAISWNETKMAVVGSPVAFAEPESQEKFGIFAHVAQFLCILLSVVFVCLVPAKMLIGFIYHVASPALGN